MAGTFAPRDRFLGRDRIQLAAKAKTDAVGGFMRRPVAFKKRDVTRATRAVLEAGVEVARVQIEKDGTISVITGKPEKRTQDETPEDLRKLI
jgi:hypothetical protein